MESFLQFLVSGNKRQGNLLLSKITKQQKTELKRITKSILNGKVPISKVSLDKFRKNSNIVRSIGAGKLNGQQLKTKAEIVRTLVGCVIKDTSNNNNNANNDKISSGSTGRMGKNQTNTGGKIKSNTKNSKYNKTKHTRKQQKEDDENTSSESCYSSSSSSDDNDEPESEEKPRYQEGIREEDEQNSSTDKEEGY